MAKENHIDDDFVQKPLRLPKRIVKRINKARGKAMDKTGESITENAFMTTLVEVGLKNFDC